MYLTALERATISEKAGTPTLSATRCWRQNWPTSHYCAAAMLFLPHCTVTLAQWGKNSSWAKVKVNRILSICWQACLREKEAYFHLKFAHEVLFFQLVLCLNTWISPYEAPGSFHLQPPTHTQLSPLEVSALKVMLTSSARPPFPLSCAIANALIRWVELVAWANNTTLMKYA